MSSESSVNFAHGLPSDATTRMMQEYTEQCLENYKAIQWKADSLLEYFCNDFKDFTVNNLKARKRTRRERYETIRSVYAEKAWL